MRSNFDEVVVRKVHELEILHLGVEEDFSYLLLKVPALGRDIMDGFINTIPREGSLNPKTRTFFGLNLSRPNTT